MFTQLLMPTSYYHQLTPCIHVAVGSQKDLTKMELLGEVIAMDNFVNQYKKKL